MELRPPAAVGILLAVFLTFSPLPAFEPTLSEESVRDAYFLGQRADQTCSDYLNLYRHGLPLPDTGPYVSEIRLLTPYTQVVATSSQHTVGYSAQQAAADYHARGDTILVQIRIELTPTFTYNDARHVAEDFAKEIDRHLAPGDFWRAYDIAVSQSSESHERNPFEPLSVHAGREFRMQHLDDDGSLQREVVGQKDA